MIKCPFGKPNSRTELFTSGQKHTKIVSFWPSEVRKKFSSRPDWSRDARLAFVLWPQSRSHWGIGACEFLALCKGFGLDDPWGTSQLYIICNFSFPQ